jgi:hypothetical protein
VYEAPGRARSRSRPLDSAARLKWVRDIEIVSDYRTRLAGEGAHSEDHEYFGCKAEI